MTRRDIFKMFVGVAGIPSVKSVEMLDVKKDDTIVLKFAGHLSSQATVHIMDLMKRNFPGQKVLVMDQNTGIEVIRARHG